MAEISRYAPCPLHDALSHLRCPSVGGLYVYETVELALITQDACVTFVYNAGDGDGQFYIITNEWFLMPIMGTVGCCVVQCFFAWRIYMLSKLRSLCAAIILVRRLSFTSRLI